MNPNILYVDDDKSDMLLMELRMEEHGISVDRAESVAQATQRFDQRKHILVVLDWNLVTGEGTEVAEYIRKESYNFPIVFLSGFYDEERTEKAQSYDPVMCLEKDVSMKYIDEIAEIVKRIEEVIGGDSKAAS